MTLNAGLRRILLLAPPLAVLPKSLNNISVDSYRYESLLDQTQQFRGAVYLEDGAIGSGEIRGGRHVVESDSQSWHLLVLDRADKVCGCVRLRKHQSGVKFSDLLAAQSSLATSAVWGDKARAAVEDELALSRSLNLPFVEIGGWALDAAIRGSIEALRMVLAVYALSREFGGAVGLATATTRHSSSSILRKIGGRSLKHAEQEMPAYQDRHYNCNMEMLRFYSWAPNPRYNLWIDELRTEIHSIPVISAAAPASDWIPVEAVGVNTRRNRELVRTAAGCAGD